MGVFRQLILKIFGRQNRYNDVDWPSVVLLLREPSFPAPERLARIAEESWGAGGPVKVIGTLREKRSYAFSRVTSHGPLWFSIHTEARKYGSEGQEPLEILQRPWDEHLAWMAIDSPHTTIVKLLKEDALEDIYKCLLIYVFKVWSPNVLAVFFPAERTTIPNFGELADSIKWGRRSGLDLRFLD
jgi:hypothetical protein